MSWAEGLTYCSSNLSHGIVTWTWRKYWQILSGQPIRDQYSQQLTNQRPVISQSGRLSLASARLLRPVQTVASVNTLMVQKTRRNSLMCCEKLLNLPFVKFFRFNTSGDFFFNIEFCLSAVHSNHS